MPRLSTSEAILAAAAALYADRGHDAVSMRDVAAAVGIQPGSLYNHYKDKDALVLAVLEHALADWAAMGRDVLLAKQPPAERLDAFIDGLVRLFFEDPFFGRLILRGLIDRNEQREAHLAKTVVDSVFAPLSQLISELSDTVDPDLTAASILSLVTGHYQLASIFIHLPRELRALSQVDASSAYIRAFVRRLVGLPRRPETRP